MNKDILSLLAVCLLLSGGIYMLFGVIPYVHGQLITSLASQEIEALRIERQAIKDQFFDLCPDNKTQKNISKECKALNSEHRANRDQEAAAEDRIERAKIRLMQESQPHVIPSGGIFLAGIIALLMSRSTPE